MTPPNYTKPEADVHGCTNVAVGTTPGATETREAIDQKLELAGWANQNKNRSINKYTFKALTPFSRSRLLRGNAYRSNAQSGDGSPQTPGEAFSGPDVVNRAE